MLELTSMEALRVNAERRREVLEQTMRDVKASDGWRHAAGVALVAAGQRIYGEMPEPQPQLKPAGDCY
jgi:hypothetical protein